jgi:hypothetical protein
MRIVLVLGHAPDHPNIETLTALLDQSDVEWTSEAERPAGEISFIPCIAGLDDAGAARGCLGPSATAQQIQDLAAADSTPPAAQPNTPDNPYFGKKPKLTKDFWAHMTAVYIALASGADASEKQKNGMNRLGRILTSQIAAPIIKIADGVTWVDPDDKAGDFLRMVDLLTTTDHEDGEVLMTDDELTAAMAAWT